MWWAAEVSRSCSSDQLRSDACTREEVDGREIRRWLPRNTPTNLFQMREEVYKVQILFLQKITLLPISQSLLPVTICKKIIICFVACANQFCYSLFILVFLSLSDGLCLKAWALTVLVCISCGLYHQCTSRASLPAQSCWIYFFEAVSD